MNINKLKNDGWFVVENEGKYAVYRYGEKLAGFDIFETPERAWESLQLNLDAGKPDITHWSGSKFNKLWYK